MIVFGGWGCWFVCWLVGFFFGVRVLGVFSCGWVSFLLCSGFFRFVVFVFSALWLWVFLLVWVCCSFLMVFVALCFRYGVVGMDWLICFCRLLFAGCMFVALLSVLSFGGVVVLLCAICLCSGGGCSF